MLAVANKIKGFVIGGAAAAARATSHNAKCRIDCIIADRRRSNLSKSQDHLFS
jgi:hypothetical protein